MANNENPKSWPKGQSGSPKGKPKGTRHIRLIIREMLEAHSFTYDINGQIESETAGQAIVAALIVKAMSGDLKTFDLLAKCGYGEKLDEISFD